MQRDAFVNRYQRMNRGINAIGRSAPEDDMGDPVPGRRLTYQEMQQRLKEQREANESAAELFGEASSALSRHPRAGRARSDDPGSDD